MVYLYHTAPRQDKESFTAFQTEMKTFLGFSSSPEGVWRDSMEVIHHSNHPRFQPLTEARISSINQQNGYMFYLDRFGDASDFTYLIVGNVNPETLKPLVEKWIGGLPGNSRKETWKDLGVKAPEGVVKKSVYMGSEPKSMVDVTFHGPMVYNQNNALRMNAMVKVLSIMLRESMREDKGGVYGVRVNPVMKKLPKENYKLTISFGCSPDNVDDLVETAMKDIRNLQDNGPSEINLGKAKETFRREHETDLEDNEWWKKYLSTAYQNGESPDQIADYNTWVQNLTAKDVQDAAKLYLNLQRYMQVVLYPAK
jgi:zinc protease